MNIIRKNQLTNSENKINKSLNYYLQETKDTFWIIDQSLSFEMKSKQKPMKHCESVYYEQPTVAKGKSQRHHLHDQGYHNNNSHFPLSATTQSVITANSNPIQYQAERNWIFNSSIKSHPNMSKASPYMQLHTIQSGVKIIGTQGSNNIQCSYSSQMQMRENYPYKQRSIYDQMADSRQFGVEINPNYHHVMYANNKNVSAKSAISGRNNVSTQRQLHNNNDYLSGQSIIQPLSCNNKSFSKGHQMRREIDGKLERVCEKVGLMSVEKGNCVDHSQLNYTNQNNVKKQLCYSTIVYHPSSQTPPSQPHPSNKPTTDNSIHHKIIQNQPALIQVYQVKIIQLQKRASLQHGKIQKLEQQLLRQRQLLIKKQKQWLLRENQLLSWIEQNEREIEQMRARCIGIHSVQQQQQHENIVVIDNTPVITRQSANFLYEQPHYPTHTNLSTHRNYHCSNNQLNIKPNSTSKCSSSHRQFSNNHSTISQARLNNKSRENNLLETHKKSNYGKRHGSNRRGSVGGKVEEDNSRDKVRRCLIKEQNNNSRSINNQADCYCNQVFHQQQSTTSNNLYHSPNSLPIHQSDYDLYQLITLQAKSIQSLMSHLSPTQKITSSLFEQKQEENLLFSSYHHCQQSLPLIVSQIY